MSENIKQNYLNHPKGLMSWLLTLDHKRIGLMYLVSGILFFFHRRIACSCYENGACSTRK